EAESWSAIGGDATWRFIKIGFSRPDREDSGLAALFTLASTYADTPELTNVLMNDTGLRRWLGPIVDSVPNFSSLGTDPADRMVNTRQSAAEIALLPESQWLIHYNNLTRIEPIFLNYPESYLLLDFPYAVWDGQETTADEQQAAADFGRFLLSDAQQRAAGEYGLRPARMIDLQQFSVFNVPQVQLTLSGSPINLPERAGALSLLRWFEGYRTAP
ncbi:MAG: substrate-binding domain-containing protein, partial [Anaerolineae bacterium]|nr:substrate-binding domain-containing protein [Anaerolineae bacterium]